MSKIITTGILEGINTRNDRSLVLKYSTQEIQGEDVGILYSLCNVYSKLLITDANITPIVDALIESTAIPDGKKAKTPSQRLRNVLYILHQQQGIAVPFEDFYATEVEKVIISYKQHLEK